MIGLVARLVMRLAVRCHGAHRHQWTLAMVGEFDAAQRDGHALSFAAGCLWSALQELPRHSEGRFTLSSYALAFGLMVPIAAGLIVAVLFDFPHSYLQEQTAGLHAVPGRSVAILHEANRAALPSLAVLIVFLGVGHLRIAWDMVECDWARVAVAARANAAITVTLAIFTALVFSSTASLLLPVLGMAVELAAIALMARWHGRLA